MAFVRFNPPGWAHPDVQLIPRKTGSAEVR
jgi:hypothetical protein